MSGDEIWMDYYSCLGPIDPQVFKQQRWVPALGYLSQFDRLRSKSGTLTDAELVLLEKLDLAELHQFEEVRELSIELLTRWLAKFKFKGWRLTEKQKVTVTDDMRRERASAIAKILSNNERWHSHSRGIPMKVLTDELNLRISDFGADEKKRNGIRRYHRIMTETLNLLNIGGRVHVRGMDNASDSD
ncbi:MAG: hypothetical protein U1D55_19785 [Phycisphaerae bacterium]